MTVSDSTLVNVRNLSGNSVSYQIPEDHRRVVFQPNEVKKIPAGELRKLYFKPGGDIMLVDYLNVDNEELREEFNIPSDVPEYEWTLADVADVINNGDVDVIKDALEFGPQAIRDAIVDYAIKNKIADNNKRKAIEEISGLHVDAAIRLQEQVEASSGVVEEEPKRSRRRQATATTSGRRVQS